MIDYLVNFTTPGHWGYFVIFLIVALECQVFLGLFMPGETLVLAGGFLAGRIVRHVWKIESSEELSSGVPKFDIDAQEQKFLMELVNKHEGRLTAEVFKGYRKLAQRMNMERIANEKELKKLQNKA